MTGPYEFTTEVALNTISATRAHAHMCRTGGRTTGRDTRNRRTVVQIVRALWERLKLIYYNEWLRLFALVASLCSFFSSLWRLWYAHIFPGWLVATVASIPWAGTVLWQLGATLLKLDAVKDRIASGATAKLGALLSSRNPWLAVVPITTISVVMHRKASEVGDVQILCPPGATIFITDPAVPPGDLKCGGVTKLPEGPLTVTAYAEGYESLASTPLHARDHKLCVPLKQISWRKTVVPAPPRLIKETGEQFSTVEVTFTLGKSAHVSKQALGDAKILVPETRDRIVYAPADWECAVQQSGNHQQSIALKSCLQEKDDAYVATILLYDTHPQGAKQTLQQLAERTVLDDGALSTGNPSGLEFHCD